MDNSIISSAAELRHLLHQNAELSNREFHTKEILISYLKANTDLEINDMGSWFYAAYRNPHASRNIAFRADFDALPIPDDPALPYHSLTAGVSHKCGHDGHSACLAAFARLINDKGCRNNVFFLFQHAEETGEGAKICSQLIEREHIDEIFGFHNMPSFPSGAVSVHTGTAACASKGLIFEFRGKTSHASQPENGRNPAFAISKLVLDIPKLISYDVEKGIILCTVIRVDIGDAAFGTSAGKGKLMLTIRAAHEDDMNALENTLLGLARQYSGEYKLEFSYSETDVFPETFNHTESAQRVRSVCRKLNIPIAEWNEPFRSSEDFGYYTKLTKGALFYVGSGEKHASLHTQDYDFPDEIIETVVKLYFSLADGEIG